MKGSLFDDIFSKMNSTLLLSKITNDNVALDPTCLDTFCSMYWWNGGDEEIILRAFFSAGAKFMITNPIETAISSHNLKLLKALLRCGVSVNRSTFQTLAGICRDVENMNWAPMAKLLIDCGLQLGQVLSRYTEPYRREKIIESAISFRKNARNSCISCIGIGRKQRRINVFFIIARVVWSYRMLSF
jgi:hypothetical protein